ncbi:MAG: hypothetical protein IJA81_01205 [Akkermansia sp.]|nr:hypothetical protein [Akkermansia sp.]
MMKTIFHKILATTALCLAAVGQSSCTTPQALSAKKSLPECYLTYSVGDPWPSEPPPVLRLNADECRELLDIEAATEPDTPGLDWQGAGGSPEFYIFPQGEKARGLFAANKVKNLTATYLPEAAAKRFDALVKTVESRPGSQLSRAEVQRWYKQYRPIRYRFYYKD